MSHASKKHVTSIKTVLFRARIIFSALLIFTFLSSSASCYIGYKSGEVEKALVSPIRKKYADFVLSLRKSFEEPKVISFPSPVLSLPSPTVTPVIYNNEVNVEYNGQVVVTTKPLEWPKSQNNSQSLSDWWMRVQEENNRKSEESKSQLEQFRQQSQQRMEEFKKEAEQGRIDFESQMKIEQEQFRQKYGF